MWLAILLISAFLAWLIQNMVFQNNWRKGLLVSVNFCSQAIFEGESSTLTEVVTNRKHLPLTAVSVRIAFSRELEFVRAAKENAGVSDQTYKRDIFSLLPMQQLTRRLAFVGKKRGYYAIENADVSAYDYFFHKGFYAAFPQDTHLYVYPKPVDTSRIQLISRAISGMIVSQNKLILDPFEFSGIREYRRSDPMNRINWKASARTGELMVNRLDATTEYRVTILLDLDDPYILKHEALLEESIRIAAGLASQLLHAKMPVRVTSNCGADQKPLSLEIPATSGNLTPLFQALAQLDTTQILCSMDSLIAEEQTAKQTSEIYVMISKNHTPELTAALKALQESKNMVLWVCPIMTYDSDQKREGCPIPLLHWEVEP